MNRYLEQPDWKVNHDISYNLDQLQGNYAIRKVVPTHKYKIMYSN